MLWHASNPETAARPPKLKDSGGGRPSKAMPALMSSWRRAFSGSRKTRPPTVAKGSTISASRGQGRGVVEVATLQRGGGARRWLTRWRTLLATTTLLSQSASPRCCGRGLARKALWETGWHGFPASAATTVAGRRLACLALLGAPRLEGEEVEGATPGFSALVRHRAGEMVHAKVHHFPPFLGSLPPQ